MASIVARGVMSAVRLTADRRSALRAGALSRAGGRGHPERLHEHAVADLVLHAAERRAAVQRPRRAAP